MKGEIMAFKNSRLSVIAYANSFTLWHYKAIDDTIEELEDERYFGSIWTLCAVGDIFIINCKGGAYLRQIAEVSQNKVNLIQINA